MLPSIQHPLTALEELVQSQPRNLFDHSRSVARLAARLAEYEVSDEQDRERIRTGSLLHDVGKQFIPSAILEKEGRLTPQEYARIQQHPWIGHNYLLNFTSDPLVLNTVLYHHERWNGSGYPFGMSGDQIPLGARICALTDVWDALVSDRCYRSAWSITQSMELIASGAGMLFDPYLTHRFLMIVEELYVDRPETGAVEPDWLSSQAQHVPAMNRRSQPPAL